MRIFVYLRGLSFVALHQHSLMVKVTSSSKSSHSQAKSSHTPLKIGLSSKKTAAVSIAKEKKSKQESIKKYVRTGNFFSFELSYV